MTFSDPSTRALEAQVKGDELQVRLVGGQTLTVPLSAFPRLLHADANERNRFELIGGGAGIHWPLIDEDISIAGLIAGRGSLETHPPTAPGEVAARRAVEEERARRFRQTVAILERDVQRFAAPIYGVEGGRGVPIGSGFLLSISNKTILVTAAHVLHARHRFTLQIPGKTRIVPFGGAAYSTGPETEGPRPDFEHDIAFVDLDVGRMPETPSGASITTQMLDVADLGERQTAYGFVGFPGSENQVSVGQAFMRSSVYYGGQPVPHDIYRRLGYDPRTHFIMHFERSRMMDVAGNIVEVPEPYGMSGGPVFKLGTFQEIEAGTASPQIIGMAIEWWEKLGVLVGVRTALISEAIRQLVPEAAAQLPEAAHLRSRVTLQRLEAA